MKKAYGTLFCIDYHKCMPIPLQNKTLDQQWTEILITVSDE